MRTCSPLQRPDLTARLNLTPRYWQSTDVGFAGARRLSPEFVQKAGRRFPNPQKHGHSATVRPLGVSGDPAPPGSTKGPLLNNVGASIGVMRRTLAYGNRTIRYYTPVKP